MNRPAAARDLESTSLAHDIRRFYLQPNEFYSLADLAKVWRVTLEDVCLMFSDELAAAERDEAEAGDFRVAWPLAIGVATVYHVFRPVDIERALGADFDRVRSERWRTVRIEVHVPRFVADGIAKMPLLPEPNDLAARAERLLCEYVHAECLGAAIFRDPSK